MTEGECHHVVVKPDDEIDEKFSIFISYFPFYDFYNCDSWKVEITPVAEDTVKEEQAPPKEPVTEEPNKDVTLIFSKEKSKKSIFASFCGCFGGKPQVILGKPMVQEQVEEDKESDEPTKNNSEEDKQTEDKSSEDNPSEDKSSEDKSPEDKSPEDKSPEDKLPECNTS